MQTRPASLVLAGILSTVLPAGHAAKRAQAQANPLGKAVQLLGDLTAKVRQDGENEKKTYYEYFEWCDDVATSTENEIKTASAVTSKLTAKIDDLGSKIQVSVSKIEDLASAISTSRSDLESATAMRKKEAADFASSEAELIDSVEILGRAIGVLDKELQSKDKAALAQLDTGSMTNLMQSLSAVIDAASFASADRQKLLALAQTQTSSSASDSQDESESAAPEADAYSTHSSGIVDVLEDMKEKGEAQLAELRKAEGTAKHNYRMLKQSLEDQIKADNQDMDDEKAVKAESQEAKAAAEGELEVSSKELTTQKAALEQVKSTCIQVAADHEKSVTARQSELETLAKASKLLQEETGGAEEQTYSLVQVEAFRNRKRNRKRSADFQKSEVVTLVRALAKEHHSVALSQLGARIVAVLRYSASNGDSPFAKVKGLIETLIAKLEKEASDEASEKAYCDEEMSKTAEKIGESNDDIAKMTSKIDQEVATSAELKRQVAELQSELATMAKEESAMTKIRSDTHGSYVASKADLEQGLTGVQQAVGVLRDYYSNDEGSAASLIQEGTQESLQDDSQLAGSDSARQPTPPQNHQKAGGAGSSIVSILEVVESDFARNLADVEEEESDAQAAFDKKKQEIAITRTQKLQDVKYKTQEFVGLDKSVSDTSSDRQTEASELAAIKEYDSKLKARCVAKPEGYAARKAARQAEINGLKEALALLENDVAFLQHRSVDRGRGRKFRGDAASAL